MFLIDLQKTFDTLDHDVLLKKKECVGFKKPAIKWFKSYLSNRTFFLSIKGIFSLFLIYINNLPQSLSENASNLYADDICICYQHRDIQKIDNVLNKEFTSLCEWFIDNKLSIHFGEDKTKANLFTRNKTEANLNICFQDHSIKQYKHVEYLGCLLDNNLCGESRHQDIFKTSSRRLLNIFKTSCLDVFKTS